MIGWLRDDPALELDAAAERLADARTRRGADAGRRDRPRARLHQAAVSLDVRPGPDRRERLGARCARPRRPSSSCRAICGPKNAYNLIRLLDLAIRWLAGEPPDVRVSDAIRPTLLAIKRGEVPMPDVMALARELTPKLEAARQTSPLPKTAIAARRSRAARRPRGGRARHSVCVPGAVGQRRADATRSALR